MKAFHTSFGGLLFAGLFAMTGCQPQVPVRIPELPLADVQPFFSEAAEVQAIDTAYYQIKDVEGEVIGTVLLSDPFSASVNGYNGPTPLIIALDAEDRITDVKLLDNHETPRFAERVANSGLYDSWDGLSVEEALALPVDAVTGATYTSTGVKKSLAVRLKAYQRQQEKDYSAAKPNFWTKLFTPKRR